MSDIQAQVLITKFEESERNNTTKINELLKKIEELESQEVKLDSGMVVAFNRESCPTGWTSLTTLFKDTEGAFIRNVGGQAKSIGSVQLDAAPNIKGTVGDISAYPYVDGSFYATETKSDIYGDEAHYALRAIVAKFSASYSSASYGRDGTKEVRPKNVSFLYCVKD